MLLFLYIITLISGMTAIAISSLLYLKYKNKILKQYIIFLSPVNLLAFIYRKISILFQNWKWHPL